MTSKSNIPPDGTTEAARDRIRQTIASGGDDTNPEFLFATTHTALLLAIEAGLTDANHLAQVELARRGLSARGNSLRDVAAEIAVADIAQRLLHLDTIATRNSDVLDFHELAVWTIREALVAAYNAGAQAAGNCHATRQEG